MLTLLSAAVPLHPPCPCLQRAKGYEEVGAGWVRVRRRRRCCCCLLWSCRCLDLCSAAVATPWGAASQLHFISPVVQSLPSSILFSRPVAVLLPASPLHPQQSIFRSLQARRGQAAEVRLRAGVGCGQGWRSSGASRDAGWPLRRACVTARCDHRLRLRLHLPAMQGPGGDRNTRIF